MVKSIITSVLVTYNSNFADEFDVTGFQVFSYQEWTEFLYGIQNAKYPLFHYVGSNQEIEYPSARKLRECYTETKLNEFQRSVLQEVGLTSFGKFFYPDFYQEED